MECGTDLTRMNLRTVTLERACPGPWAGSGGSVAIRAVDPPNRTGPGQALRNVGPPAVQIPASLYPRA